MNGTTIYQNENNPNQELQLPSAGQPIQNPPPPPRPRSFGILGKFIKFLVGLSIISIIGFFVFGIVVPHFTSKKETKVELTYWGLWENVNIAQSIISDFERQNPNITIKYTKQDIKQYRERLIARIQNGTGPDVFRFHNTWVSMLSRVLLPLPSDTITKADFGRWFYNVAQTDLIKNGAIFGIPLEIDTLALYINTNLLNNAGLSVPTSWIEFADSARRLTVKDENGTIQTAGAALGTFNNITHAGDVVSIFFAQGGVNLNNIQLTSQVASDALSFYTSFAHGDSKVWDETLDSSIIAFAKENLAMYFGYSRDVFVIKAVNPNLSFAVYSLPRLGDQNRTIASYWAEGVSAKSQHQKEALSFLKFLAKKETEEKLFAEESKTRLFGEPYAHVELADTLKDNTIVYPFVSQAKDAVSSFFASDTYDNGLNSQMNSHLGNAVNSILSGNSPQSAVETLSQGVSQVLKQYSAK